MTSRWTGTPVALVIAGALLLPGAAAAQTDTLPADTMARATPGSLADSLNVPATAATDTESRPALFSASDRRNLLILLGVTLAVMPLDERLTDEFRDNGPQRSTVLHDGARVFDLLGNPGTVLVAGGAWALGRMTGSEHLADLGLHVGQSLALTLGETYLIKGVLGRRRPYLDETDPDDFSPGLGFTTSGWASLPSGHTAAAFAVAASANEEMRHWWPAAPWAITPLLYAGASMVGLARIYDDRHWASDVILGAGLGILTGRKVARYRHGTIAGAKWPRWPLFMATGRGLSLDWSF